MTTAPWFLRPHRDSTPNWRKRTKVPPEPLLCVDHMPQICSEQKINTSKWPVKEKKIKVIISIFLFIVRASPALSAVMGEDHTPDKEKSGIRLLWGGCLHGTPDWRRSCSLSLGWLWERRKSHGTLQVCALSGETESRQVRKGQPHRLVSPWRHLCQMAALVVPGDTPPPWGYGGRCCTASASQARCRTISEGRLNPNSSSAYSWDVAICWVWPCLSSAFLNIWACMYVSTGLHYGSPWGYGIPAPQATEGNMTFVYPDSKSFSFYWGLCCHGKQG